MTDQTPPMAGEPAPPYAAPEMLDQAPRKSRRGLVIGASAAVLAVVAGAAVWATTTLSGGGRQPDSLVPKNTFAYLKVDLDPAANQKLAARSYFGKFPGLRDDVGDTEDVFENVLSSVITGPELDYKTDVRPWFDRRGAVAAFPAPGGEPHVVAVLRSKDDGAARAKLDELVRRARADGEEMTYRITDGYVVTGKPPAVDAAVQGSQNESLEDNEVYRNDVDSLDGDQVAVAWFDIAAGFDQVKGALPGFGLLPNALTSSVKGRLVAGLHFENDFAEVQGRTIGFDSRQIPPASEAATLLAGLPADTSAAVAVHGLRTSVGQAGSLFNLDALLGQYLQGSGLSFSKDVLPVIGDEAVLAVGPSSVTTPRIGYVSTVAEPTDAEQAGTKLAQLLSFFGIEVEAGVNDRRFVLATPPDYAKQLAAGNGGLGASPKFTKAMGDLKGAALAVYVDADQPSGLGPLFVGTNPGNYGVSAAGLVMGATGDSAFFRLRVVAKS